MHDHRAQASLQVQQPAQRAGLHPGPSLPGPVPLGQVPQAQGSAQDPYPARPSGHHPLVHRCHRWPSARRKSSQTVRSAPFPGQHPRNGQGLY